MLTVIHIEVERPPSPERQRLVVRDELGRVVARDEVGSTDSALGRKALERLRDSGVRPDVVYIGAFSGIAGDVRAVWPEARLLMEYW